MKKIVKVGFLAFSLSALAQGVVAKELSAEDQVYANRYGGDQHECSLESLEIKDGPRCAAWSQTQNEIKARNICFDYEGVAYFKGFYCGTSPIPEDLEPGFTMEIARSYFEGLTMDVRKHYQREMRAYGYYSGAVDGKFGPATSRAIHDVLKAEADFRGKSLESTHLTDAVIGGYMFDALNQFGD